MAGTLRDYLVEQAKKYNVPPELALAVVDQESSGQHQPAGEGVRTSDQNARGFFQVLPATAWGEFNLNPDIPMENIEAGVRYLRQGLDRRGSERGALAYYHGGPNTRIHGAKTAKYVDDVWGKVVKARAAQQAPGASVGTPPPRSPTSPAGGSGRTSGAGPRGAGAPLTTGRDVGAGPTRQTEMPVEAQPEPGFDSVASRTGPGTATPYVPAGTGRASGAGPVGGGPGGPAGPTRQTEVDETSLPDLIVKRLMESYDPRGYEGRQNIAATGTGMLAGSVAGYFSKNPVVARWAETGGSGLGGAVERGVEELVGSAPPAPPDSFMSGSPLQRSLRAGGEQAAAEAIGQGITSPLRTGGKLAVQNEVSRHTADYFRKAQREEVTRLQRVLLGIRDTERASVAAAQGAKKTGVESAEQAGKAAEGTLRQQYKSTIGPPPSEAEAGGKVAGVLFGQDSPGQKVLDVHGQAITAAAKAGPAQNIQDVQKWGRGVVRNELLPATAFPSAPVTKETAKRSKAALNVKLRGVSQAQWRELQKDPRMGIIAKILYAKPDVSFAQLHQWKSDLGNMLDTRGVFDQVTNSKLDNLTKGVFGQLSEKLEKAGYTPYDDAVATYRDTIRLFKGDAGELIKREATNNPEMIAQMFDWDRPTQAGFIHQVLTQVAPQAGRSGARAGSDALTAVQEAFMHRKIYQGDLDTLGKRLTELDNHPEFTQAFGLDTPQWRQVRQNLRRVSDALTARQQQTLADVAAAETTGEAGVAAAQATRRANIQKGLEDVRGARVPTPEHEAFRASSISPQALASSRATLRQYLMDAIRTATYATGGASIFGPSGSVLGVLGMRAGNRATDADLLQYLMHLGRPGTETLVRALMSPKTGEVVATGAVRPFVLPEGRALAEERPEPPPPPFKLD